MIQLGNGILVEMDGCSFRFDPKRVLPDEISMISHAHSDHLPSSFKQMSAICSPITRDLIKARRNKEIAICSDDRVTELEAGHIAGSKMFLVDGEMSVLYTGDFCTREKEQTKAARPRKCDILITEATYGKPQYVFPDHDEIMSIARDWLRDIVAKDGCAVLYAYPLGKSQELSAYLKDLPLVLHPAIAENNRILRKHGYDLVLREYDGHGTKPPFVYITSGMGKDAARVQALKRHGAKIAAFSGWALDKGFMYQSGVDEAFPISDHCGFDELIEFVRRCSPQKVFTNHGFSKEFAMHVRRSLGIQAQPLVARQRTLDHFC
jgi:putative mRNA 3-end processing factor